ncbi:hypothetical protein JCM10908_004006 [Rhodotorula pacifica]|uniref:M48 family metallopeptidase n=1 Tax=Rhodotorula pacifica TaxID=1495444 RepID=UPI00317388D5
MPRPRLATFDALRRPVAAPVRFLPASRPRPAPTLAASWRPFGTSPTAAVSYRRFGSPQRRERPGEGEQPQDDSDPFARLQQGSSGNPNLRQDLNAKDVFTVLDVIRRQQQQGGRGGALGGVTSPSYRHDPRQGFSWHNFKAYIRSPFFLILVAGGGTYYVLHLERVEETGRWRFMDVSPSMEVEMGEQAFQETIGEFGGKVLAEYHPQARQVQHVVKRIIQANGLEGKAPSGWKTFVVKDDATKNAFVLPNGTIFVFTGILPVAADADGLACVLGHEIAHQVARHSAERMSGMKVFYGLALLLASLGIDMGLSQVLLQFVYSLPNSRKNETEADLIGLRLANQACFDPRAAEGLWHRMSAAEESPGVDMSFLSTHPSSKNRTVQVRKWAEEIIQERPSECGPLRQQIQPFQEASRSRW